MTRLIAALVVLCIVAIAGISVLLSKQTEQTQLPEDMSDVLAFTKYWKEDIKNKGAEGAYEHFKEEYEKYPQDSHGLAHLFIGLIFEEKGVEALALCDTSFGNGCFHGLVSRAILAQGTEVLFDIVDLCSSSVHADAESCFHGVGHGVMEYVGGQRLREALTYCTTLEATGVHGAVDGCVEGVFMDYNVSLSGPRSFEVASRFSPCDQEEVREEYRSNCYYSLPHWWFQQEQLAVSDITKWCSEVPSSYTYLCYKGIGIDLPGKEDFDEAKIIAGCHLILDEAGEDACLDTSLRTFVSLGVDTCMLKEATGAGDCS